MHSQRVDHRIDLSYTFIVVTAFTVDMLVTLEVHATQCKVNSQG
jgi:hypothetical protein